MNIHVHIHNDNPTSNEVLLKQIFRNTEKIMATIQELNDKVDSLQSAIDAEQVQIQKVIDDLQAIIDAGDGATPEELQALSDKLDAAKTDLEGTVS